MVEAVIRAILTHKSKNVQVSGALLLAQQCEHAHDAKIVSGAGGVHAFLHALAMHVESAKENSDAELVQAAEWSTLGLVVMIEFTEEPIISIQPKVILEAMRVFPKSNYIRVRVCF